jgi:hypothetical protein
MQQRRYLWGSSAGWIAWLRIMLRRSPALPGASLGRTRKLMPIDHVLARVGRDPLPPD